MSHVSDDGPVSEKQRTMVQHLVESQDRVLDKYLGAVSDQSRPTPARLSDNPVDERPWVPVKPDPGWVANTPRSGVAYADLLDALPLLESPRYQPHAGLTFCNIFVWDATRLLGCEVPHWVDHDGSISPAGWGREQTANDMADWLSDYGQKHGWGPCGPATAQLLASRGNPAVAVWRNPGGIGHIAMVRPGELHPTKGPCIAQAGKTNFRHGHVLDGFGAGRPVEYYVHLTAAQKSEPSSK